MFTHLTVGIILCLQFYLTSFTVVFRDGDSNELELGSTCRFNGNKSVGICRAVRNCPGAHRDFRERNISPTICGYGSDSSPVVCCGSKRRYETYCELFYGDPDTDRVCPRRSNYFTCEDDTGELYSYVSPSGGERAGPVPHMAALGWRYDGVTRYKCGGVLISETFVLTAAHCTEFNGPKPNIVRTGAVHLQEEHSLTTFRILEIISHPEYKPPAYYHDMALVRFSNKTYEFHLAPKFACLPPEHLIYDEDIIYDPLRWNQTEALGYGATSFGGPTDDMHLIRVKIDLLPDQLCTNAFPPDENQPKGHLKSMQICAGDVKAVRDTCQGDSGGPLQRLFKRTLVSEDIPYVFGITSFGRSCATGAPGVYTRITSSLDWIESIVWPTAIVNGVDLRKHFSCDEYQKLCLKKIRNFYKKEDPYWPVVYKPAGIGGYVDGNEYGDERDYDESYVDDYDQKQK